MSNGSTNYVSASGKSVAIDFVFSKTTSVVTWNSSMCVYAREGASQVARCVFGLIESLCAVS